MAVQLSPASTSTTAAAIPRRSLLARRGAAAPATSVTLPRIDVAMRAGAMTVQLKAAVTASSPTTTTTACSPLARAWRDIQGAGDWDGMVAPLHPLLRNEIVRYGEFVAATYKAFDLDPTSKHYLRCKHGKERMLQSVGMDGSGYTITKYIYATPDVPLPPGMSPSPARWIGYVAVSNDKTSRRLGRRDILVAFRGTVTGNEWIANMMSSQTAAGLDSSEPRDDIKVEYGFLSLYTSDEGTGSKFTAGSCRNQLLSEISRLVAEHSGEEMSITLAGHSMGSALALLLGYDLAELGLNKEVPIAVYSFAGPRVGNQAFKKRCEELGVKVLRVVNVKDPVTNLPGGDCYAHVGVEIALDFFKARNPACVHDLEAYIGRLKSPRVAQYMRKEGEDIVKQAIGFLSSSAAAAAPLGLWGWYEMATHAGALALTLGIN